MDYLLDTCAVTDFVKGDTNTLDRLKTKSPLQIKISAITAFELQYGLQKNKQIKRSTKKAVLGFLDDIEIVPFSAEAANVAAEIRAGVELAGKPIGAYDILIAATALDCNFILVTSNEKEFARIPRLKIENWRLPMES
ncbi:MAG: type II toxin-antitoxin system VapC family toxin [Leptolyngbya sp. SIO1D8]|nr:type II toxin-antitoxin system VapC family toxin [Leptolyngbya sp. SIO1D8]